MKNFFQKLMALPMWYSVAIVAVFALLSAEMARELQLPIMTAQAQTQALPPTMLKITTIITFVSGIFSGFFAWAMYAVLYHVSALLFGGKLKIGAMFKIVGFSFLVQIPFVVIQIVMFQDLVIPEGLDIVNELADLELVKQVSMLNYVASVPFYALLVCAVRYVYDIKWWRAILAVVIPSALLTGVSLASASAITNLVK